MPQELCVMTPLLGEFLSGRLEVTRREEIQSHLEHCAACQSELRLRDSAVTGDFHPADTPDRALVETRSYLGAGRTERFAGVNLPGVRYRTLRPHAKGGLGEVFVAKDLELNREVAVKEIRQRGADDADTLARFVREAEITGGLEHPGIVPVYGLCAHADGRPYYAMRFIHGEDLRAAIERFHASPTVAFDSREFRQLIGRLVAVCNAVAYAHSRGVVHRDLKPSNIMLGRFGETLVVDWGLAKVLADEDADSNAERLQIERGGDVEHTLAGEALGTPTYMSPEQAAGMPGEIGPASDIYSLGATLFSLLTNRLPVEGTDVEEVLSRVRRGQIEWPPQLPGKDAPPAALRAVCARAMALRPADRYSSALDLAADLENFLADEPVEANVESTLEQSLRWMRKRPGIVAGGTAAALVSLLAVVTGSILLGEKNSQLLAANLNLEASNGRLTTANAELTKARQAADLKTAEATKERNIAQAARGFVQDLLLQQDPTRRADELLKLTGEPVSVKQNPAAVEYLDRAAAEVTPDKIEAKFPGDPRVQADVLYLIGTKYLAETDNSNIRKAIDHLDRALPLYERVYGRMAPQAIATAYRLGSAYYTDRQWTLAVPLLERVYQSKLNKHGPEHFETKRSREHLAKARLQAGEVQDDLPALEAALERNRRQFDPESYATRESLDKLVQALWRSKNLERPIELYQQEYDAIVARRGKDHLGTYNSALRLAGAYLSVYKSVPAAKLLEETLQSMETQPPGAVPFETFYAIRSSLCETYKMAGKYELAVPVLRKLVAEIEQKEGTARTRRYQYAASELAYAYFVTGDRAAAIPLLAEATDLARRQSGQDNPAFANSLANTATRLLSYDEFAEAEKYLVECLDIRRKTAPEKWNTYACQYVLGMALVGQKKFADADVQLREAWAGIEAHHAEIPAHEIPSLRQGLQRLILLYAIGEKPVEAALWQGRLDGLRK